VGGVQGISPRWPYPPLSRAYDRPGGFETRAWTFGRGGGGLPEARKSQPNSIAFWDNRCVQHHALWDYYPNKRYGRHDLRRQAVLTRCMFEQLAGMTAPVARVSNLEHFPMPDAVR
jgi:hypothetical protein